MQEACSVRNPCIDSVCDLDSGSCQNPKDVLLIYTINNSTFTANTQTFIETVQNLIGEQKEPRCKMGMDMMLTLEGFEDQTLEDLRVKMSDDEILGFFLLEKPEIVIYCEVVQNLLQYWDTKNYQGFSIRDNPNRAAFIDEINAKKTEIRKERHFLNFPLLSRIFITKEQAQEIRTGRHTLYALIPTNYKYIDTNPTGVGAHHNFFPNLEEKNEGWGDKIYFVIPIGEKNRKREEIRKTYYPDGQLQSKTWYQDGKEHREDEPAYVSYYKNGNKKDEKWYQDSKEHREDGPAHVSYYENGNKDNEAWYRDGKVHREDGPAVVFYYKNGNKRSEEWYRDGKEHKEDGPAVVSYYKNGNQKSEEWYRDSKLHREDGSARVFYYENGNKESEIWYRDGKLHREDGPAWISYYENGNKRREEWYRDGIKHRKWGLGFLLRGWQ